MRTHLPDIRYITKEDFENLNSEEYRALGSSSLIVCVVKRNKMKNKAIFNLINRPRMTYSELLESMHYNLGTHPELKNALVTDVHIEENESSIFEGAVVMQLYDPVECVDGTLTIPVNRAVNTN